MVLFLGLANLSFSPIFNIINHKRRSKQFSMTFLSCFKEIARNFAELKVKFENNIVKHLPLPVFFSSERFLLSTTFYFWQTNNNSPWHSRYAHRRKTGSSSSSLLICWCFFITIVLHQVVLVKIWPIPILNSILNCKHYLSPYCWVLWLNERVCGFFFFITIRNRGGI